ncbi:PAS domain S-box protein [Domibacillus sp. A3M-37]|uniref:PAS domain S-box protein n=1 Tax=Domibacillus sp. A3M-37 TaxID=2962037 RepID=UPI0020B87FC5|nr:PAS domain S-box protein [Domibacillus sp. A3M-37]MCP3764831.1 PAS domain S-box protein [Domibacillus sp. A3M-37]
MNINYITNQFRNNKNIESAKRLIDSISASIWHWDLEKNSFWISSESAKIYGYTQEDFEKNAQLWKDFVFPEDINIVESHIEKLLTGMPYNIEYRIIRPDGISRWVQESADSIKDEKGNIISSIGTVFDITERKKAMIQLAESEERSRNLNELSPNAVLVHQEGKFVYANPESLKMMGAKHVNEILGKKVKEILMPEELDTLKDRMGRLLNGEKLSFYEYKVKTLDGRVIDVESNAVVISFDGKPAVMTVGKDITEKKKLYNQLEDNKQRYQSLIEFNANSVYSLDINGYFTSCNTISEKMIGYTKEEILKMHFLDFAKPEEREKVKKQLELVKKGTPQNFRTTIYHKNGSLIHLNVSITPIMVNEKLDGIYGISQDITKQVEIEKYNEYMAFHDYLTGLPNRNMLHSRLSNELTTAAEKTQSLAVLMIDLDRFKVINDTLGHDTGDLLLKEVTTRLKSSLHDSNIIFRQSGDEFIVILADADRNVASKVCQRILDVLAAPYKIKNYDVFTSASIGISQFPKDGETAEELIKHADFAMYQAKKAGKNNYKFYFSNEGEFNPLQMEADLYKAMERDELLLHYQPKINLKTGNIVGVEALIRWNHPEKGMISPVAFIPFAEETGLIIPIGEWALHTACKQQKAWQEKGFSPVMAVNLSARQFTQSNFVHTVAAILKETGLEPQYLELEITESMTVDIERTISTLQQLKNLGVHISIDDFGTGFSSLNYLKQFPVDTLKIDQSFVQELHNNPNDETIVKTIISMAHNLNLNVVAEGIETKEQLVFLQQHLCDEGQGYFFSAPLPANEVEKRFQEIQQLVTKHGISQDINERIWAEELLYKAKNEMQDTVRLQQGMILKFRKINDQFIHTLCDGELLYRIGLIPSQVVGKTLYDFLSHEGATEKTTYYQRAWEGEELVTYENKTNGIHYLASLRPIKRGQEVIEVIGSCVDITARKKAEEALRESEYKYRLIAENMTDLILLIDVSGNILYASPSHKTLLGFSKEFFKGKNPLDNIHPEEVDHVRMKFKQSALTKTPSQMEFHFLHGNGNWILIECVATPVIGGNGQTEHIIVVGRDITEKRKAEELLAKSEKLTVVGELAAGVAHEIRNPLTSIKGFVKLMQQGMVKEKFFDILLDEFNRIEEIIKEFLNLAKPQEIQLMKSDLKKILKEVETLLESEAHLQNVQIGQQVEQNIPPFMGDPNQIKQVFINLIKNSIEAMPNGGFVNIQASEEGPDLLIKITDNGIGINKERLRKLGEPFFSNKEKGTGLGLMLCFRIVSQHKGTITFKSKENQGTTVEVRLPLS